MRVPCQLRQLRLDQDLTIREMEDLTGIHRGKLSMYETGRWLVDDGHVAAIEAAYGAPAHEWYLPALLLMIERDKPDVAEDA